MSARWQWRAQRQQPNQLNVKEWEKKEQMLLNNIWLWTAYTNRTTTSPGIYHLLFFFSKIYNYFKRITVTHIHRVEKKNKPMNYKERMQEEKKKINTNEVVRILLTQIMRTIIIKKFHFHFNRHNINFVAFRFNKFYLVSLGCVLCCFFFSVSHFISAYCCTALIKLFGIWLHSSVRVVHIFFFFWSFVSCTRKKQQHRV